MLSAVAVLSNAQKQTQRVKHIDQRVEYVPNERKDKMWKLFINKMDISD